MAQKKNHAKLKKIYKIKYTTGIPKFPVGTSVRIAAKRKPFDRLYSILWSPEVFTVDSIGMI